ncbi:MAG: hydrogenase maturation protease [Archaeoglobaceae archaeon]|nr:hydrogenase maturation protease [Archaeoglobaceae archaeon]MDW7990229.1 hydrogenase maturation protease [Archaeoglobaceae archaeon]
MKRTAIIGIGNILLGDEGVGVHLIERLKKEFLPENVELYDCGVSGLKILNILESFERIIIIDALKLGKKPGTIYIFSIDPDYGEDMNRISGMTSLHDLDLTATIQIAKLTGFKLPKEIVVLGIEPKTLEPKIGLSSEVEAAIEKVTNFIIENLIECEK